jgi:hypothetical protein
VKMSRKTSENKKQKIIENCIFNTTSYKDYTKRRKRLGTTVRNQNYVHEEIERKLNSGNARHHSF